MFPALQLYSVGDELKQDFEGTLQGVAAIGFHEVEAADLHGKSGSDFRTSLERANLKCTSMHRPLPELVANLENSIGVAKELQVPYIVCSVPWIRDAGRVTPQAGVSPIDFLVAVLRALTIDDWKWTADQLNRIGERTKAAGLQLAYHNHNFEFRKFDGVIAYDEVLRLTDPNLVKLELDCAWACVAGQDPLRYLKMFPQRFRLLHLRDFEPGFTPTTDLAMTAPDLLGPGVPVVLGTGMMNYESILPAARDAGVEAYIIERDPFYKRVAIMDVLRADYDYLRRLISAT